MNDAEQFGAGGRVPAGGSVYPTRAPESSLIPAPQVASELLEALVGLRGWVAQIEDDGDLDDHKNAADRAIDIAERHGVGPPVRDGATGRRGR